MGRGRIFTTEERRKAAEATNKLMSNRERLERRNQRISAGMRKKQRIRETEKELLRLKNAPIELFMDDTNWRTA